MKCLVTGGAGFIGTNLIQRLILEGYQVFSLDNYSTGSRDNELSSVSYLKGDIELIDQFNTHNFDYCFHLAAQSLVISGQLNPKETLETNIIGTFNILNWSSKEKEKVSTIVATTDKVYRNPNKKNTEEDELGSFEFYGASKVGAENVINAFNLDPDTKNKASVVRSGNVLGGGDGGD